MTWGVVGEGPGSETFDRSYASSALSDNTVTLELRLGDWDLTVTGYDDAGAAVFTRSSSLSVSLESENTLSLVMAWVDGLELVHLAFDETDGSFTDAAGRLSFTAGTIGVGSTTYHESPAFFDSPLSGAGRVMSAMNTSGDISYEGAYIDAGGNLDLGESFTLSLWTYPVVPSSNTFFKQALLSTQQTAPVDGTSLGSGFTLSYNTYGVSADRVLYFETSDGSATASVSSGSAALAVEAWQHVAVVVDGVANTATIYLNGQAVGTGAVRPGFSRDNALRLCGMRDAFFYTGSLDDVRVYAGALSPSEVASVIGRDAFSGGSGTDSNPYLVTDAYELNNARRFMSSSYRQTADINLTSSPWESAWPPIGPDVSPFTGSYEGGGFAIENLVVSGGSDGYQGLFGYLNGAEVSDLTLTSAYVSGGANIGALAGYAVSSSISGVTVSAGSHVSGSISNVGGLLGYNDGSDIIDCVVSGTSTSTTTIESTGGHVGGICGYVEGGSSLSGITVSSFVTVTSTGSNVGGIAGDFDSGSITASSFSGTVNGVGYVGGIAGWAATLSLESTNLIDASVTGSGERVGGLVGSAEGSTTISGCEASGTVTGPTSIHQYVGGLVGHLYNSSITDCSSACDVSGYSRVGGIAGYAEGASVSGVGVSEATISGAAGGDSIGGAIGYAMTTTIAASSTRSNTSTAMSVTGGEVLGGFIGYSVQCAISEVIVTTPSVDATMGAVGGLVGSSSTDAEIRDCVVTGAVLACDSGNMGGFVGLSSGSVFLRCGTEGNCSNTDAPGSYHGGFAGYLTGASSVSQCYAKVMVDSAVDGSLYTGGFAGAATGTASIDNCYATGDVAGDEDVGGFIGHVATSAASIQYCFARGEPSIMGGSSNLGGFGGFYGFQSTEWPASNHRELYWENAFVNHDGNDAIGMESSWAVGEGVIVEDDFLETHTDWDPAIWVRTGPSNYPHLAWED